MSAPLPPLPPVPGVPEEQVRPGGRSMLDILAADHDQIIGLCAQLADDGDDLPRRQVVDVLVAVLSRHISAEEQYLFPTVRATLTDGDVLADEELTEDVSMLQTLKDLHATSPDDAGFPALVDAVTTQARRHTQRATYDIFPRLREACGAAELIRLGNRVVIAQEAAPTRPHPATPVTPPANKIVDPAVGMVDKVRDVLSGRPTRPADVPSAPAFTQNP